MIGSLMTGNNIYGTDICEMLSGEKGSSERAAYILMDKVNPQPVYNYLLGSGSPLKLSTCLTELGTYGAYVRYAALNGDITAYGGRSFTLLWNTFISHSTNLSIFAHSQNVAYKNRIKHQMIW